MIILMMFYQMLILDEVNRATDNQRPAPPRGGRGGSRGRGRGRQQEDNSQDWVKGMFRSMFK